MSSVRLKTKGQVALRTQGHLIQAVGHQEGSRLHGRVLKEGKALSKKEWVFQAEEAVDAKAGQDKSVGIFCKWQKMILCI